MEKVKQIAVVAVLVLVLWGIALAHLALPDNSVSSAERRPLEQLPVLTAEGVFSGDYFAELEQYLLDQFPLREQFRSLKANFRYKVLGMQDNNGIYAADGHLSKLEYPMQSHQAQLAVDKINSVIQKHPEMGAVYYGLIPDKNYFLAEANGFPVMDYAALVQLAQGIDGQYIDLFPLLSIDDYYRTDSHWRQERIVPVAQALCRAMGTETAGADAYTPVSRDGFYGVYAGQSALRVEPETLTALVSPVTEAAVVRSVEHKTTMPVYTWQDFEGVDPYDVYLSGAEAIVTMENPLAENNRELVVFRDSFGSSIAPLLLEGYSKVTLVDLRYIASDLLDNYVSFDGADVLFLYSTALFNAGNALK